MTHPHALKARECFLAVLLMTAVDMDDWYEAHVGYRLSDDSPDYPHVERAQLVAGQMFFEAMPSGLETPDAERVERILEHVIAGHDQAGAPTPYPLLCPSERAIAYFIETGREMPTTKETTA